MRRNLTLASRSSRAERRPHAITLHLEYNVDRNVAFPTTLSGAGFPIHGEGPLDAYARLLTHSSRVKTRQVAYCAAYTKAGLHIQAIHHGVPTTSPPHTHHFCSPYHI